MYTAFKRLTLAASVALAVTGCATVGSDFAAPKNVADASFRHQAPGAASEARLPAQWWTVFGDATLDRLEQTALRDNPGVKAAGQRLLQVQAQSDVTRANQSPSVNLSTSVANSRTSAETSQALALGGRAIKGNQYTDRKSVV